MANKRHRSGRWYYRVKHRLLPRPLYVSFEQEAEGDAYVRQLESLLAVGVVPKAVAQRVTRGPIKTLGDALTYYEQTVALPESDRLLLKTLAAEGLAAPLPVDFAWAEGWVAAMKSERLAPSTIRHKVGAVARGLDWLVRKHPALQEANPLRLLPKRYASYRDGEVRDQERDRRLSAAEEAAIRRVLAGEKVEGRERALEPDPHLTLLFDLALETAMRLREIFTLTPEQVDLGRRTIFLDRTKNGDSRQVPLSSVACARLNGFTGFQWLRDGSPEDLRRVTSLLSRRFGTVFEMAGCADLHFHDLRHSAVCRFYETTAMTDLQIARITGHRDLRMLRRYASFRGSDLAAFLR